MPLGNIGGLFGQIRFAARRLLRTPAFTTAAIALLGVGMAIAAATASLLNVALFKDPAREKGLVHVAVHRFVSDLPAEVVSRLRADPPTSFETMAGFGPVQGAAVADGVSRRVAIEAVTGRYFSLFGAVPAAGRLIQDADDGRGHAVAVISRTFWRSAFGQRPDVLGEAIAIGGQRLTIVGVVDEGVRPGARGADVWVPSYVLPVNTLFGRLRPGVTLEQANAELVGRYGQFEVPGGRRALEIRLGLSNPMPSDSYLDLVWIVGLMLTVSLVASVSFGLLLFARMAATQADMAVRIALGATSRDLTRLLAFEVVVLALAATVVAVNVGSVLAHVVASTFIEESGWRATIDTSPDWRVFLAVGVLTLAVALAVVARLGWSVARVEALGSMVSTGGMGGATVRTAHTSTRLVIAQSAATAALLLFAALVMRNALGGPSMGHLDATGMVIAWLDQTGHADAAAGTWRARGVLEAAARMSGVGRAALVSAVPGTSASRAVRLSALGERRSADVYHASAGTFDAFGLSVVRGRLYTDQEDVEVAPVAVVGEATARRFWPGLEPIGRRLSISRAPADPLEVVVIGVVSDVGAWPNQRDRAVLPVYLPVGHRQGDTRLAVFARGNDADRLAEQVRTSLQAAVPDTAFLSVRTLEDEFQARYAPPLSIALVFGLLGGVVFVVAMGGLYGLMSYLATMRRREVGIRKALGATSMALCRMLIRESSPVLVAGIAIGIVGVLALGPLFDRGSFRLLDPVAILGVAGFLYVAGLAGSVLPYVSTMRAINARLRD